MYFYDLNPGPPGAGFGTRGPPTDVTLLFYVHGKHLRSCWDGQLT